VATCAARAHAPDDVISFCKASDHSLRPIKNLTCAVRRDFMSLVCIAKKICVRVCVSTVCLCACASVCVRAYHGARVAVCVCVGVGVVVWLSFGVLVVRCVWFGGGGGVHMCVCMRLCVSRWFKVCALKEMFIQNFWPCINSVIDSLVHSLIKTAQSVVLSEICAKF